MGGGPVAGGSDTSVLPSCSRDGVIAASAAVAVPAAAAVSETPVLSFCSGDVCSIATAAAAASVGTTVPAAVLSFSVPVVPSIILLSPSSPNGGGPVAGGLDTSVLPSCSRNDSMAASIAGAGAVPAAAATAISVVVDCSIAVPS